MKKESDDTFLNLIKGVSPLKKNDKLKKKIPVIKEGFKIKKKTKPTITKIEAVEQKKNKTILNVNLIEKNKINKKLKKGKININKKIDFHGMSVQDAELLFICSIKDCYKKNLRCILFVTGKGYLKNDKDKEDSNTKLYYGKIRANFLEWIKRDPINKYILNVEPAGIKQGGDGAFFVYLRKEKFKS